MKTSVRPREIGGSFATRRGHAQQLSISDTNHHVTEAIGDMYGDDDYTKRDPHPAVNYHASSPLQASMDAGEYFDLPKEREDPRPRSAANSHASGGARGSTSPGSRSPGTRMAMQQQQAPMARTPSLRHANTADAATSAFPLNDIDYESNPAAVAQELHNLQALRRMSMDIGNTSDPDLPTFSAAPMMPPIAPTGDENEDDPSRLFWVPARMHPELAPMEFKTFLEKRAHSIKRRSGDPGSLSPEGIERSGSGGGLRRKKSMLSRQIDNSGGRGAVGYHDGAEQLERKKSSRLQGVPELSIADLQDINKATNDASDEMQSLRLEADSNATENGGNGDILLPQGQAMGLRRSRNTTYRKGTVKRGDRAPFSKRGGSLRGEAEGDSSPISSPIEGPSVASFSASGPGDAIPSREDRPPAVPPVPALPTFGAERAPTSPRHEDGGHMALSEPGGSHATRSSSLQQVPPRRNVNAPYKSIDHSRQQGYRQPRIDGALQSTAISPPIGPSSPQPSPQSPPLGSNSRSTSFSGPNSPVPQIVETPPPSEAPQHMTPGQHFPARTSSQKSEPAPQTPSVGATIPEPPVRSNRRPTNERPSQPGPSAPKPANVAQTVQDLAQSPTPVLGNNARTDTLTFIPTLDEKKQPDKKLKKDRDTDSESTHSTHSKKGWGWFKGGDEKDKKEKKRQEEELKRNKLRASEKAHENARLDVLQSTMEPSKPRESLLLDREASDNRPPDDRGKAGVRKSGESKKERDGLFSSIFGGKKKGDKHSNDKKANALRALSPEPPRLMRPDIDYNWTRFSILEERAIYRMAHIKLANPRRALYSQVLLSNFMYSYLAKVQQMHPHMQIPQSMAQKRAEAEKRQQELVAQQRKQQEQREQQQYDYHQGISQYAETSDGQPPSSGAPYVDDSQIYRSDYHGEQSTPNNRRPAPAGYSQATYNQNHQYSQADEKGYYYGDHGDDDDDDDEDMW